MFLRSWPRAVSVGLVVAIGAAVACGDASPPLGVSGGVVPAGQQSCRTPQEGCACSAGASAPCAIEAKGDENFIWCAEGVRTCEADRWGACRTSGSVSVKSRASAAGVGIRNLGSPGACPPGFNPCDPYCHLTNDTPGGFNPGPGFGTQGGGIVAAGCGGGSLGGGEECDDGNLTSGDGCSDSCVIEPGYQCAVPGAPCTASTCGNGVQEGSERCDDGNLQPFDGCSPTCQREASCPGGGECVAVCGDGLKFPTEACDDGNTTPGDGCSATCTVEPGATCNTITSALPSKLDLPIIYRDFTPVTNPDFESFGGPAFPGIVMPTLAPDAKPVLVFPMAPGTPITSQTSFFQWYHDTPGVNQTIFGTLQLNKQPDNSYLFTSNNFFPLTGKGFGNFFPTGKNFHFTSEVHYPFTFSGGEVLNFSGDDDVWVFVNGRLVVDLGGLHAALPGGVTLTPGVAAGLGLVAGRTYEVSVFHAERHTTGSNYTLTLRGFERARSSCFFPGSLTIQRDYAASCPSGFGPKWQLFRWRAAVPVGGAIAFRAATADSLADLPVAPAPAPVTVNIGSATATNSPLPGAPALWQNEVVASQPIPVSQRLRDEANTTSKSWLRVFMSFTVAPSGTPSSPRLDEWQQLYDCVPSE